MTTIKCPGHFKNIFRRDVRYVHQRWTKHSVTNWEAFNGKAKKEATGKSSSSRDNPYFELKHHNEAARYYTGSITSRCFGILVRSHHRRGGSELAADRAEFVCF